MGDVKFAAVSLIVRLDIICPTNGIGDCSGRLWYGDLDAAGKLRSIYPKIFIEIGRCISRLPRQLVFNKILIGPHSWKRFRSFMEEIPIRR